MTENPYKLNATLTKIHRDDLVCGFKGKACSFEHRDYDDRQPGARKRYDDLKAHLLEHGMKHPILVYQGHVLIGMRRFEIMKDHQEYFDCLDIQEDVYNYKQSDITRLQNFNTYLCGTDVPRF